MGVLVVLDLLWLAVIAKPLYQQGIGHLMAERAHLPSAIVFYFMYVAGLMVFAVVPHEAVSGWRGTAVSGALLGFFAYATYDLTNLAVLKGWPLGLSLIDMTWGTFVTTAASVAGKLALDRFATN
jgi:uncharacterized membrane protein